MIIDITKTTGTIGTGIYLNTLAASIAGMYILSASYTDPGSANWGPASIIGTPDPFTIVITSITTTRLIGTFSGTIRDNGGSGTNTKAVTNGIFNVPVH